MLKLQDAVELYVDILKESGLDEAEKSLESYSKDFASIFPHQTYDGNQHQTKHLFEHTLRFRIRQNKDFIKYHQQLMRKLNGRQ